MQLGKGEGERVRREGHGGGTWRAVKPAMAVRVASVMAPACSSGPRHDRARRTRQDRHGSRERHPASDRAACCWCPSRACRLVSAVSAVAAVRPARHEA